MRPYKYVQLYIIIIILNQHVSATSITIIRDCYKKNKICM